MSFNVVWLRNDLRLRDNPAFALAQQSSLPLRVVFIVPPYWLDNRRSSPFGYCSETLQQNQPSRIGLAKARFLRASLIDLQRQLYRQNIHFLMVYQQPLELFKQWQLQGIRIQCYNN